MSFSKLLSWSLVLLALVGCAESQEGSLFSNSLQVSACPEKSCAQGVADPNDTRISLTSPFSYVLPKGNTLGEVTGECYPSLFPQNFLSLRLLNPAQQAVDVAPLVPPGFIARCTNGRFYVPVNLFGQAPGNYTLEVTLVVVDAAGTQIRPPNRVISANLVIPNP